jgi:hypothetical protein
MVLQITEFLPYLGVKLDFNQLLILVFVGIIIWLLKKFVVVLFAGYQKNSETKLKRDEILLQLSQNVNKGNELSLRKLADVSKEIAEAKTEVINSHALGNEKILNRFEAIEKTLNIILSELQQ